MKYVATAALAVLMFSSTAEAASGYASYYKMGRRTANGERFSPMGLTCAHRNLPFGTKLKVTNVKTGRSVVVRVNDRGPFVRSRVLDLSLGAAQVIGLTAMGIGKISYEVVNR